MDCPRCASVMDEVDNGRALVDVCRRCGGVWFDPGELGASFGDAARVDSWTARHIAWGKGPGPLACPRDGSALNEYGVRLGDKAVDIDICTVCAGLFFDRGEAGRLAEMVAEEDDARQQAHLDAGGAKTFLFQMFTGFPLEVYHPVQRKPWALWTLMFALVGIFALQIAMPNVTAWLALVPKAFFDGAQPWAVLSYALLHGGLFHIVANSYFLYIFGDNIEDRLGPVGFVVVFVVTALCGGAAHALAVPDSLVPMVGASGATSGLMGCYLVLFPRIKVWWVLLLVRLQVGVWVYLLVWVGLQLAGALSGKGNIAWWAHLGGFAAGLLCGFFARALPVGRRPARVMIPESGGS